MSALPELCVLAGAGPLVGWGHVLRTLSVARAMAGLGAACRWLVPPGLEGPDQDQFPSPLGTERLASLTADAVADAWSPERGPLFADTYQMAPEHYSALRGRGFFLATFDDGLGAAAPPADLAVAPSLDPDQAAARALSGCRVCAGPQFFPLRPEFRAARKEEAVRRSGPPRLVLTFGGSDPDDMTARIMGILADVAGDWRATVLLGPGYRGRAESMGLAADRFRLVRNPPDMAAPLADMDLAVSGAGGTALELASLGVPSLLIPLTPDQTPTAALLAANRAALDLGFDPEPEAVTQAIAGLLSNAGKRRDMAGRGRPLVDGRGAERIAQAVSNAWMERAACGIKEAPCSG